MKDEMINNGDGLPTGPLSEINLEEVKKDNEPSELVKEELKGFFNDFFSDKEE